MSFESLDMVSYSHSIVTTAVSCIVSEIPRHSVHTLVENRHFSYHLAFDALVRRVPVEILPSRLVLQNYYAVATRWWKKF